MTKRTRYLLIGIGFAIFAVLAPVIVLYVRGISYDFTLQQFVKTGILAVRTEPKSVEITLNGELVRESAGNIKFLKPGEYDIKLSKEGYFDWTKRLQINSDEVTWANTADKVFLLSNRKETAKLSSEVRDYAVTAKSLAYLTSDNLVVSQLSNLGEKSVYELPLGVNSLLFSPDGQSIALSLKGREAGTKPIFFAFSQETKKFTDLSSLFASNPSLKFSDDNSLYALENGLLFRVDLGQTPKKTLVQKDISAFTVMDKNVYYIQQNASATNASFLVSSLPSGEPTVLFGGLPDFKNAEIIISPKKEIFLGLDNALYEISDSLKILAQNISQLNYAGDQADIIFSREGELEFFDSRSKGVHFITRTGLPIFYPIIKRDINYAFAFIERKLTALELDTRDHQNQYIFYEAADAKKISIDAEGKNILILDGNELLNLKIR